MIMYLVLLTHDVKKEQHSRSLNYMVILSSFMLSQTPWYPTSTWCHQMQLLSHFYNLRENLMRIHMLLKSQNPSLLACPYGHYDFTTLATKVMGFQRAHKNWCLTYSRPLLFFHSFGATCPFVFYIYHAVTETKCLLPWKFAKFMGSNGPIHDWPSFKVNRQQCTHVILIMHNWFAFQILQYERRTLSILWQWTYFRDDEGHSAAITTNWCKNRALVQIDENGWHSLRCSLSQLPGNDLDGIVAVIPYL